MCSSLPPIDNGKEAISLNLKHTKPPTKSNSGVELYFSLKDFAVQNSLSPADIRTKGLALLFDVTSPELVPDSFRRLIRVKRHGKEVLGLDLEVKNRISVWLLGEKTATESFLTPGRKSRVGLVLSPGSFSVTLDSTTVFVQSAASLIDDCSMVFGGHGAGQEYEHELFKGVIGDVKILHPVPAVASTASVVPLSSARLWTEQEMVDTLDQLCDFDSELVRHMNPGLVPLRPRGESQKKLKGGKRSVLVCHDAPGGHAEDSHLYGDFGQDYGYRFRFWQNVDYFCYFGHHTVVVPPAGYIAAGHRAGVKVLGTFVTEPGGGEHVNDAILRNELPKGKSGPVCDFFYADKLVQICTAHGFDGYLINIEARVLPELIPKLVAWLQYLRYKLKAAIPHAEVIWYDSILENGVVRWQSMLNPKNSIFFDACDKFFTDYHWGPETHLPVSVQTAGERSFDVLFGNDVYGRGTYGGGMLNTHVALDEITKHPLSIALFGQAYYYQNGTTVIHNPIDYDGFEKSERRFWLDEGIETVADSKGVLPAFQGLGARWEMEGDWAQEDDEKVGKLWVSSFTWCTRSLSLNLAQLAAILNVSRESLSSIEFSVKVKGKPPKCGDPYTLFVLSREFHSR